jgi:hypothetical protein
MAVKERKGAEGGKEGIGMTLKGEQMEKQELKEQAVMVTTEFRGVFFGYLTEMPVNGSVTIKRARNCVYWSQDVRGFMGLASGGPTQNCKVGPAVSSITLNKVTSIAEVSPEAEKKWNGGPWA